MNRTLLHCCGLLLLGWLGLVPAAHAQNIAIRDVRVGFPWGGKDFHRPGSWAAVAVQFAPAKDRPLETVPANTQASIVVEGPDAEGAQTRAILPLVNISRDDVLKGKPFITYIKLGNANSELRVLVDLHQATDGGRTTKIDQQLEFAYPNARFNILQGTNEPRYDVRGDQRFILALGNISGLPLPKNSAEAETQGYVISQVTDPNFLPTHWQGYEGVDAVILATGGTWSGCLAQVISDSENLRAPLLHWVAQGGHLVIAVCSNAPQMQQSALSALYPADLEAAKVQTNVKLDGVRVFVDKAGKGQRGQTEQLKEHLVADTVGLKEKHPAVALAAQAGAPILVHAPFGLGRVTLIAFDINGGGFTRWPHQEAFWRALLSLESLSANRTSFSYDWDEASKPGMEAAGAFVTTMESFGEMPVVSFFLVAVFILGYILLIGPIDYFFLKKVVKRLEWTWITFPTLVLVVSIGAYLAAFYIKGDELRLNKVDLVELDLTHQRAVGNSWVTVFSPNLQKYDLELAVEGVGTPEGKPVLSWLGRPGFGPRGMDRQQTTGLFRRDYQYGPDDASLQGVPIQVWGMKSFTGRWHAALNPGQLLDAKFSLTEQLALRGEITSRLPVKLTQCSIMYKNLYWELGTLEPGKTIQLTGSGVPRNTLNDFRPLSEELLRVDNKSLASFSDPLSKLMYPQRRDDSPNRPPSAMDELDQSWRLQRFDEVVFLATVENSHGGAAEQNAGVRLGTKFAQFNPALRGTLRQSTFLRAFIPVEKRQR